MSDFDAILRRGSVEGVLKQTIFPFSFLIHVSFKAVYLITSSQHIRGGEISAIVKRANRLAICSLLTMCSGCYLLASADPLIYLYGNFSIEYASH